MSKIGRNAPCPCGSGKKYKKCCIDKAPTQPRFDGPQTSFASLLAEIVQPEASPRAQNIMIGRAQIFLETAGISAEVLAQSRYDLPDATRQSLFHVARLGPRLPHEAYQPIGQRRPELSPGARALLAQIESSPPWIWWLESNPRAKRAQARRFGSDDFGPLQVHEVFRLSDSGEPPNGLVFGWYVQHGKRCCFLHACDVSDVSARLLTRYFSNVDRTDLLSARWRREDGWIDVFAAVLDPFEEFDLDESWEYDYEEDDGWEYDRYSGNHHRGRTAPRSFPGRTYVHTMEDWYADFLGYPWSERFGDPFEWDDPALGRLSIHRALTLAVLPRSEALDRAICAMVERERLRLLVDYQMKTWYAPPLPKLSLDDARLEKHCPIEKLQRLLPTYEGEIDLSHHPLGLLLLPDDHPVYRGFGPTSGMGEALTWANTLPDSEAKASLRQAAYRFELEERWLHLKDHLPKQLPVDPDIGYERQMDALFCLFDPRLRQTPLADLGLSNGSIGRLRRGLVATKRPFHMPVRVEDLPRTWKALDGLPMFGGVTQRELFEGLTLLFTNWRQGRVGLSALATDAKRADATTQAAIKQGLDELQALFNLD